MSAGKIFVVILGVILLFIGIGLALGGGTLLWANLAVSDNGGYYSTKTLEINRDSYAITTYPARINFGIAGIMDWPNLVKVKVAVNNKNDKNVYIGIVKESDLRGYLGTVSYDEIRELRINHPFSDPKITYTRHTGSSTPGPPTSIDIWTASAYGDPSGELTWGVEEGSYSVVVMNQDGSRGIDMAGTIGVKVPMIFEIGVGLLAAGAIFIIFAFLIVYTAASSRKVVVSSEPSRSNSS
ncbi:hypothetical protein KGY64_07025 [Candidatus Bipolaricaulota bacterium]|nr:hypothetical protein [Candidatus Bipolaricaulota bacterium]